MKSFFRKSCNLLLVALLFFSGLNFLPSGLVVCYGADGHIAIELGESDCNNEPQQIADSPEAQKTILENNCGNCTDIPVLLPPSETAVPEVAHLSFDSQPVILVSPEELLPGMFLKTATESQLPQPPPILDPFLKVHRTVVLLI